MRCMEEGEESEINANLLRINKSIYDEAAPILYGLNRFIFPSWTKFYFFNIRLTQSASRLIRSLDINFPEIDRTPTTKTPTAFFRWTACHRGVKILHTYRGLQNLTFNVDKNIMACDIDLLRTIRASLRKPCRVEMKIRRTMTYYEYGGCDRRTVLINSVALTEMQRSGWRMAGEWELIDERHRFQDEQKWVQWLHQDEKRGVDSGMIELPDILSGEVYLGNL